MYSNNLYLRIKCSCRFKANYKVFKLKINAESKKLKRNFAQIGVQYYASLSIVVAYPPRCLHCLMYKVMNFKKGKFGSVSLLIVQ